MSEKNFKIAPKVWPKEYTFEEFKTLNPNINENILINYFNKYLFEYAEDRSRHIHHFNDVKDNLSEEIRLLKNKRNWNYDGDQTVGPTGAGRKFRSPLSNKYSMDFDGTGDYIRVLNTGVGNPGIKPEDAITVAAWVKMDSWAIDDTKTSGGIFGSQQTIVSANRNGGWSLAFQNSRAYFTIKTNTTKTTNGAGTSRQAFTAYNRFDSASGNPLHFRASGWHYIVGTWDGITAKLYIDGVLNLNSGTNETASSTEYIIYDQSAGKDVDMLIGMNPGNNDSESSPAISSPWPGLIDEVAIWNTALDITTIQDLFNTNVLGSIYNLSYPGYNDRADHPYDLNDEGLSYKNVGRYANNLQGWWGMEEGSGIIAGDSSTLKNKGTLVADSAYSTSTPY